MAVWILFYRSPLAEAIQETNLQWQRPLGDVLDNVRAMFCPTLRRRLDNIWATLDDFWTTIRRLLEGSWLIFGRLLYNCWATFLLDAVWETSGRRLDGISVTSG